MRGSTLFAVRRAYTLIEMLIVVALLGISGTLLIPQLVGRDLMATQAATRLIIGDVAFAQSDALAHQEIRRMHFYEDGRGYCIVRITTAQLATPFDEANTTHDYIADPLAKAGDLGRYIVDFVGDGRFDDVEIESVDIDGGERDLNFDELGGTIMAGGVPGTGGTIVLRSPDARYEINIAPFTGKLTVVKLPLN